MPRREQLHETRSLQLLRGFFGDPSLWHLHRRSVANAFSIGLFMAWVPVPFQMLLAALAAIVIRVNLPISVGTVWVSNPLTIPPMFYLAYRLGAQLLGVDPGAFDFELSLDWVQSGLLQVWRPFLLGCLVLGLASSLVGGVFVRVAWRVYVVRRRNRRRV